MRIFFSTFVFTFATTAMILFTNPYIWKLYQLPFMNITYEIH